MKILYSPGFGAGWSSWETDRELQKLMLTWPPFIAAVCSGKTDLRDLESEFVEVCNKKFGKAPYTGALHFMDVEEIPDDGAFHICEYDGSERVVLSTDAGLFLAREFDH